MPDQLKPESIANASLEARAETTNNGGPGDE